MKRKYWWLFGILLLSLCLLVSACARSDENEDGERVTYYTVTYDSNGGSQIESRQVSAGGVLPDPGEPTREGYIFAGWTLDGVGVMVGVTQVKENMTVRASWISAESLFEYQRIGETDTAVITVLKSEMEEIKIPTSIGNYQVVAVGDRLFYGRSDETIQSIYIPETVTTIGEEAFGELTGVQIVFSEKCRITSLGERAFFGCTGLTEIPLGEGLSEIPYESFSGSGLTSVRLPKSVTKIEENAFDGCLSLVTVMLHETVTSVENAAFFDCDALKTIFFYGTEERVESLLSDQTQSMNQPFTEARVYLYAEKEPSQTGTYEYWYLDENNKTKIW
ncbi:MAG: leucine-rich repeat protein [Clostridia bacterium]|nr:leucine-rich repeat protein [Clostridia bacterium]